MTANNTEYFFSELGFSNIAVENVRTYLLVSAGRLHKFAFCQLSHNRMHLCVDYSATVVRISGINAVIIFLKKLGFSRTIA